MEVFRFVGTILFILYLLAVIYFMFLADGFHRGGFGQYRYNLKPFQEIYRYPRMLAAYGTWTAVVNLFGNVLVFMPFGFYVPFYGRTYRKWYFVVGLSFLFSLFIESTQLITQSGVFDVDDLMLNTLGGALGYLCYFIAFRVYVYYLRKENRGRHEN